MFETNTKNLSDLFCHPKQFMAKISDDFERIQHLLANAAKTPEHKLLSLARKIKPLIRVSSSDRQLEPAENYDTSKLVYIQPFDIYQSYLYSFYPDEHIVCDENDNPLEVSKPKEIARFICYHRTCGCKMFLRPSVSDVLQQLPKGIDISNVSAFEIVFSSDKLCDIYNEIIDHHVSVVILYSISSDLPEEVKTQPIIIKGRVYNY